MLDFNTAYAYQLTTLYGGLVLRAWIINPLKLSSGGVDCMSRRIICPWPTAEFDVNILYGEGDDCGGIPPSWYGKRLSHEETGAPSGSVDVGTNKFIITSNIIKGSILIDSVNREKKKHEQNKKRWRY